MKIAALRIKDYKQFKDIKLDFTDLKGNPVDKICFIGRNGTGKSTLLRILNELISDFENFESYGHHHSYSLYVKFEMNNKSFILFQNRTFQKTPFYFSSEIENENEWFDNIAGFDGVGNHKKYSKYILSQQKINEIKAKLYLQNNKNDLLIYAPPESSQNSYLNINDVPSTTLNQALPLFDFFPFHHIISDENVQEFWKILIYLIKKRENEREEYETKPENINKTKKQLIAEFDKKYPKILTKIAELWNKILANAGLEFDLETASNPIQLNDNLKAYIRLKSTKERINYNQLSTGIRNFIFRVGHIYSLYFNRKIKNGFLLIDEPENSLFPDFLFDLIETYQEIIIDKNNENNTQFFVSTHNPIIAAQFEPYERIILEWNDEGFVDAFKGKAPIGDDPNDLLINDFSLENLMGKKGQEMWDKYLYLRKKLTKAKDKQEKNKLISQINKIGQLYNFDA